MFYYYKVKKVKKRKRIDLLNYLWKGVDDKPIGHIKQVFIFHPVYELRKEYKWSKILIFDGVIVVFHWVTNYSKLVNVNNRKTSSLTRYYPVTLEEDGSRTQANGVWEDKELSKEWPMTLLHGPSRTCTGKGPNLSWSRGLRYPRKSFFTIKFWCYVLSMIIKVKFKSRKNFWMNWRRHNVDIEERR